MVQVLRVSRVSMLRADGTPLCLRQIYSIWHSIDIGFRAGFYYVCVDFNPQSSANNTRSVTHSIPPRTEESVDIPLTSLPSPGKMESVPTSRRRRDSSVRRGGCGSSIGPRSAPPAATMSGFYFHQNSEPYVAS